MQVVQPATIQWFVAGKVELFAAFFKLSYSLIVTIICLLDVIKKKKIENTKDCRTSLVKFWKLKPILTEKYAMEMS